MIDLLDVASLVIEALDRAAVRYTVGGSLAASFSGEPRASIDVDIVVDMAATQIAPFIKASETSFTLMSRPSAERSRRGRARISSTTRRASRWTSSSPDRC